MRATATWFGPPGRRLFGYVHIPEGGRARGVVVMCRPLGREAANALPAIQALADQLAGCRGGRAALRLRAAPATRPATSTTRPRMTDWLASIDEAVSFARRSTDGPVVLLGMRMGALLAIEAVARGTSVDHLVVWDPCASGREFLRVERTLLATGYGAKQVGDGSVAGPAFVYSAETVEELSALTLSSADYSKVHSALVAVRSEGRGAPAANDRAGPRRLDRGGRAARSAGCPSADDHPAGHHHQDDRRLGVTSTRRPRGAPFEVEVVDEAEVARDADGPGHHRARRLAGTERAVRHGHRAGHRTAGRRRRPWCSSPPGPSTTPGPDGCGSSWPGTSPATGSDASGSTSTASGRRFGRPDLPRQVPKPPEAIDDLVRPGRSPGRSRRTEPRLRRPVLGRLPRHRGRPPAASPGGLRHQPGTDRLGPRRRPRRHRPPPAGLPADAGFPPRPVRQALEGGPQVMAGAVPGVGAKGHRSIRWPRSAGGGSRCWSSSAKSMPGSSSRRCTGRWSAGGSVDGARWSSRSSPATTIRCTPSTGQARGYPLLTRWILDRFAPPAPSADRDPGQIGVGEAALHLLEDDRPGDEDQDGDHDGQRELPGIGCRLVHERPLERPGASRSAGSGRR